MLRLLAVLFLSLAHAQGVAPAPATTVSPAQARQVLDVLTDDKKRQEFTTTLEAIANAVPAAASKPAIALPLAPDSLGAQVVDRVTTTLAQTGQQLSATVQSVNDLPVLQRWIAAQASDATARARLADAAWKLLVVLGLGVGADRGAQFLLRRTRRRLADAAPPAGTEPGRTEPGHTEPGHIEAGHIEAGHTEAGHTDAAQADADKAEEDTAQTEAETRDTALRVRRHRLNRAFRLLQRLPFVLGRFLLDLLPVASFILVAYAALATRLGEPATNRLVITTVATAYVTARVALCLMRMLVSPALPRLRLLNVSDWMATFVARWSLRLTVVAVTGHVVAQIGLLFGMYQVAYDSLLKLVGLLVHGGLVLAVLQCRGPVARHLRAPKRATGFIAGLRNRFAQVWHIVAIFYIVALWVVWALELPDGYTRLLHFFLVTTVVAFVARLLGIIVLGTTDRLLRVSPETAARYPGLEERVGFYHPLLRQVFTAVVSILALFTLLVLWGFHPQEWFTDGQLGDRVLSAVLTIGITVVLAVLVWEGSNAGIERHLARLTRSAQLARSARLRTLLPMLRTALLITILLIVVLMVLSEVGVNIAPLLAGAGVVGIAVGFGSQKLVQDLITGLFLLLENAMQVGDVVTLGGLSGTVEALSIRTIRLRALDGSMHIIPFSAVTTVTNQTRDFSYAVLDVSVGLNEEPDDVVPVLKDVAAAMRADPAWADVLCDDLDVMGVEKFIDTAWILRARIKTLPASRWSVARELNRRIKLKFDELAIESPITSYRVLASHPAPAEVDSQPKEQAA